MLYAVILDIVHFRHDDPDLHELGRQLGGTRRLAQSAIKELVAANLLVVHRRGLGKSNVYTLLEPDNPAKPEAIAKPRTRKSDATDRPPEGLPDRPLKGLLDRPLEGLPSMLLKTEELRHTSEPNGSLVAPARRRNVAWDFLVELEGEPLPRHRAGRGAVAADLNLLLERTRPDADDAVRDDELRRRWRALHSEWGEKATGRALVNHWERAGRMAETPSRVTPADMYRQAVDAAREGR